MKNYIYDGSFQGFLTIVYEIFTAKDFNVNIISNSDFPKVLFESKFINTDLEKAEKVIARIKNSFSNKSLYNITGAFLSDLTGKENLILSYIILGIKYGKSVENKLDEDTIFKIIKTSERTYKEAHRIKGILRFKELADNSFYAPISPDNNILPVIYRHFEKRFPSQNFIIHDIKRKICIIYNGSYSEFYDNVIPENSVIENHSSVLSSEELVFQNLWKNYFSSIAIKERQNLKLQMKFVPKKYWNYITEMEKTNE